MRYLNELVYCLFFENVYICLTVEPRVIRVIFKIGKIFSAFGFVAYAYAPVRYKVSVTVKRDVIACDENLFSLRQDCRCFGFIIVERKRAVVIRNRRDKQLLATHFNIARDKSSCIAGRPFVLVIQP